MRGLGAVVGMWLGTSGMLLPACGGKEKEMQAKCVEVAFDNAAWDKAELDQSLSLCAEMPTYYDVTSQCCDGVRTGFDQLCPKGEGDDTQVDMETCKGICTQLQSHKSKSHVIADVFERRCAAFGVE